ncbi:acyl-CoA dehydratase activase [Spirochaeta cellobiosiphila]|uniref:acyl-CoA dehydratase activase n=1 Tax=Spirochaeta cellobiosiphila TaxID=504483 RepID=UPI0004139907|nr:acyl-CoA dehydratase activase [Spirochaeta cellobiosiphila]
MEKLVGIDVGSTTVKITVVDKESLEILHSRYERHNAEQGKTVQRLLIEAHSSFPDDEFKIAICGSAGQTFAKAINAFYIQEVVANTLAVKEQFPETRVAIELGGQDAKVIFFEYEEERRQLIASDMRMNGSCAGGTGAFIDQVAELLNIRTEEFNKYASKGKTLYDISGRCGVFAKTDIQPLLNQGVSKEDIALSSFHALAKQTIGGLAQGMTIKPKVIFEGGPLTFNPRLIEVFKERLGLSSNDVIIPPNPEILVAYGAALSLTSMYVDDANEYKKDEALKNLEDLVDKKHLVFQSVDELFFNSKEELKTFKDKHKLPEIPSYEPKKGEAVQAYLGIDAGSTTSKFVLINDKEEVLHSFYSSNKGEPISVVIDGLKELKKYYDSKGATLDILGVGTTGYGENLFAKALKADYHSVETVAHARAAQKYAPNVSFILDIGGQDMKAISLQKGIVSGIVLNEACSAGCGSFVETYARSLGVKVSDIADLAFEAKNPSRLGSRCTVFMNSSIITEQKNGKTSSDILAGICRSIIENVFTKVVRVSNWEQLGSTVMVQGGTFKNDAVLRSLEQYTGRNVVRAPYPGEMGAIGIALLTKEHVSNMKNMASTMGTQWQTHFIGFDGLKDFTYKKMPGVVCRFCTNNCMRTIVEFSDGTSYVTGNRCEKGEVIGDIKDKSIQKEVKSLDEKEKSVPDMLALQEKLLFKKYPFENYISSKGIRIGLPRTLDFWNSMPFWNALFSSLGFEVVLSDNSSYELFDKALPFVPSDTICFPAKLSHGHIESLCEKGVDAIFFPQMSRGEKENKQADSNFYCAVIQGYAMVTEKSNETLERFNIPIHRPLFHWFNHRIKVLQISEYFEEHFDIDSSVVKKAIKQADNVMDIYRKEMQLAGEKALAQMKKKGDFGVLIASRPYHVDPLINHNLSKHFTRQGIAVFTLDSLPNPHDVNLNGVRMETTINFHTRMVEAALQVARDNSLELVQIVSFGCGHDAVISDEMTRILRTSAKKEMLVLKLDEGEAVGPLNIRIKSFVETVKVRRSKDILPKAAEKIEELKDAFPIKFRKQDKKDKVIYIPNLSPAFSYCLSEILKGSGFMLESLPVAGNKAIELGKKYVHNDICYPAQINIGEFLAGLDSGDIDPKCAAMGVAKNCEDCRAGQYPLLARKALDEAGYPEIPVVTTGTDKKHMHPGFKLSIIHQIHILWGLTMIDGLEKMRRRIRPYEKHSGETNRIFDIYMKQVSQVVRKNKKRAMELFQQAIEAFNSIALIEEARRPRVGIIGEILMNYHPGANGHIEEYLENHGMEVVVPNMHDFFRKSHYITREMGKRKVSPNPVVDFMVSDVTGKIFDYVNSKIEKLMVKFKFHEGHSTIHQIAENIKDMIDVTYLGGEGWKIPGEIIEMEKEGVNSFIIIQPFGCLPNHITGRGFTKPLKKQLPHIQMLSLDYDPDTSFANIENRLQMLIINAKELEKNKANADK